MKSMPNPAEPVKSNPEQFTPGPWKSLKPRKDSPKTCARSIMAQDHDECGGGTKKYVWQIADVLRGSQHAETEEDSEANAHLIAAAPDLLDACQQLIAAMYQLDKGHHREVAFAEDALRKARGQA